MGCHGEYLRDDACHICVGCISEAAKILANLIVMGSGILARAVVQAYHQALTRACKQGKNVNISDFFMCCVHMDGNIYFTRQIGNLYASAFKKNHACIVLWGERVGSGGEVCEVHVVLNGGNGDSWQEGRMKRRGSNRGEVIMDRINGKVKLENGQPEKMKIEMMGENPLGEKDLIVLPIFERVTLLILGAYPRALVWSDPFIETNASKTGVAQETIQNGVRRASKIMTEQEARQILGITERSTWEEIAQASKYDNLFENNAKNGSFYLQSKVHRAKECLEPLYQHKDQGTST
ncbi:hypothetical protein TEA_000380 [Camellia sinensis var. sinensis]|uniref:Uncharacterized protein n=1 Tax=Camellia sinensis var. sinensis TaxID=542762 RepID=A0A4S4DXP0_CAMSN|nr:hypothetical protein TEA_000380 [Camellia sinensis var. sinensis]